MQVTSDIMNKPERDHQAHVRMTVAGRYLLGDVLGSGGMGVVYSATQITLGRRVAIKVPHAGHATDELVRRRFRTEAIAGGRLDHHNLAGVLELGDSDGVLFLVMEYVAGTQLDRLLAEHGPMGVAIAVELCQQILAALDFAHTAGVIHADVKSGNVLVETRPDHSLHVRVIDFGLARLHDARAEGTRLISGTPDFLAPEIISGGAPTVSSDLYAVGVILYELLTGSTPFGGGTCAEILARQTDDAVVPPSLRCPEQALGKILEEVVMRALRKEPSERFDTAAAFSAALRLAHHEPCLGTLPVGTAESSAASAEVRTRDWTIDRISPAIADGHASPTMTEPIRFAFDRVRAGSDGDVVVASYLELVREMIDQSHLAAAATELARALTQLRANASTVPAGIWRLQLCLAALYSGLRDPLRARVAARLGKADATRAGSTLGEDRADTLLARLARHRGATRSGS